MRQVGLSELRLHRATLADPAAIKAPDLLGRDFTAEILNASFNHETRQGTRHRGNETEARLTAFGWPHRHNTRRRHPHLGPKSPIDHENSPTSTPATLSQAAQPCGRHPG
ncbi:hypothetical protein Q5530_06310 [Saccharothrix sp. BKS2]|uniref:hypothetical protein n=1 Tax=Saccharothrix sp. BKS2 TaxID=3064400 RepID=UPI0039E84D0D